MRSTIACVVGAALLNSPENNPKSVPLDNMKIFLSSMYTILTVLASRVTTFNNEAKTISKMVVF